MSQDEQQQTNQIAEAEKPRAVRRRASSADSPQQIAEVQAGFDSIQGFEFMQRVARMLTSSTLVPVAYRAQKEIKEYGKVVGYEDNPNALSNAVVAVNMAMRMKADPLMVMQNLYVVEGRPSWSSQFIIAALNTCGRYSPLRFEMTDPGQPRQVTYKETYYESSQRRTKDVTIEVRDQSCYAWAIEKSTGQRLLSPIITVDMAVAEGWITKKGSKWQTMPEVMLRYRCASFFGKLYAPELLMGIQSTEEAIDLAPEDWQIVAQPVATEAVQNRGSAGLAAALRGTSAPPPPEDDEPASTSTAASTAAASTANAGDPAPAEAKADAKPQQAEQQAQPATTGRRRAPSIGSPE